MSVTTDWLVRRDLTLRLSSLVSATQTFEADIDINRVVLGLPEQLQGDNKPIWLPILRLPSQRVGDQRVTNVRDGAGRSLPIMRQADVQSRFASALTWLLLTGHFRSKRRLSRSEIAHLESLVYRSISDYLATGHLAIIEDLNIANSEPFGSNIATLAQSIRSLRDKAPADPYLAGFVHSLEHARTSYFATVGIDPSDATPHVTCDLLPAEMELTRHWRGFSRPEAVLELDLPEAGPELRTGRERLRSLMELALSALAGKRPSIYYLEIPVPELAQLENAHVSVSAEDDVCINPSVLHDDQIDRTARTAQSRRKYGHATESSVSNLVTTLKRRPVEITAPLKTIVEHEVNFLDSRWRSRLRRLRSVHLLLDKVVAVDDDTEGSSRSGSSIGGSGHHHHALAEHVCLDPKEALPAYRHALDVSSAIENVRNHLKKSVDHKELTAALENLKDLHHKGPIIEYIADDDPRDNVAHFHVADPDSVFRTQSDRRPMVRAVVRPSKQAREDYMRTSTYTCFVSTLLTLTIAGLVYWPITGNQFAVPARNVDALAALLLLVPGISLVLLGRIPGDSLRYLVLSRSARWAHLSLFPTTVQAILLATQLGILSTGEPSMPEPWFVWSLLGLALGSISITGFALIDTLSHRNQFDYDVPIGGWIRYSPHSVLVDEPPEGANEAGATTSAHGPHELADHYHSLIDTAAVADMCNAGLFRSTRPERRFMVWVVVPDSPDMFYQVIRALDELPKQIQFGGSVGGEEPVDMTPDQDKPSRTRDLDVRVGLPSTAPTVVVESSVVLSVPGTGTAASIISCESRAVPPNRRRAENLIEDMARGCFRAMLGVDDLEKRGMKLVVDEVVDDSQYLVHRTPLYVDVVYAFPDGSREVIARVLRDVLMACSNRKRVSYIHCPTEAASRSGDARPWEVESFGSVSSRLVLKLGFAIDRDQELEEPTLIVSLEEIARAHGVEFYPYRRRMFPDVAGSQYDVVADTDGEARAYVSAGRENHRMLLILLDIAVERGLSIESATVLTLGRYAARAFILRGDPALLPSKKELTLDESDPVRDLVWMMRPQEEPTEELQKDVGEYWIPAWLRWRLREKVEEGESDIPGGSIGHLLGTVRRWRQDVNRRDELGRPDDREGAFTVNALNIEYLIYRSDERGYVSGKAKYALKVRRDSDDVVDDEIRQSLQDSMDGTFTSDDKECFIVVSEAEPKKPQPVPNWLSEFSPY